MLTFTWFHRHGPYIRALALLVFGIALPLRSEAQGDPFTSLAGSMTGSQLVSALRDAANNVVTHAGDVAKNAATSVANDLNKQADQLNTILGAQINKPVTELRQTFATEIERSLVELSLAQTTLDRLRRCLREDVQSTVASLQSALSQTTKDVVPWARGNPQVLSSVVLNDPNGYGLRVQSPGAVRLTGLQLSSNCQKPSGVLVGPDGKTYPLSISIEADTRSVVNIPAVMPAGVYRMSLAYPRKHWIFFCNSYGTDYSVPVLPAARFTADYRIGTRVNSTMTREFHVARFNEGSDDHNDRHPSQLYLAPPGWTYVSHRMDIHSNNGSILEHEDRSGNGIFMQWRVPAKGGCVLVGCFGAGKWVDLEFYITAVKDTVVDGPVIATTHPNVFSYGQTLAIPISVALQPGQSVAGWSVSSAVHFPDGSLHAIDSRSGDTPLTAAEPGGAKYSWDPASGMLTVTAPLAACTP